MTRPYCAWCGNVIEQRPDGRWIDPAEHHSADLCEHRQDEHGFYDFHEPAREPSLEVELLARAIVEEGAQR
jgi:hypothetical protein